MVINPPSPAKQDHNRPPRSQVAMKMVLISITSNMALAVIKIIGGLIGNSYALIADGIESTLDIFSTAVVFGGLKIGSLPPDENHPFGHGKAEPLAAMVVSLGLIAAAIFIAVQSTVAILTPNLPPEPFTLYILIGVVVIKETLFRVLLKTGETLNSVSVKVDAWHHRSDSLTSFAAFIGISIALFMGKGYESADAWAALFASGVILFNGASMLRISLSEAMDETPGAEVELKIRALTSKTTDVLGVEKCRVRKSGLDYFVDIHVEVNGDLSVRQGHEIAHSVKDTLINANMGIVDCVVHIEPPKEEIRDEFRTLS